MSRTNLQLPENVVASKVSAACKDGVLTVTLAKSPQAKPKHLEIKVA